MRWLKKFLFENFIINSYFIFIFLFQTLYENISNINFRDIKEKSDLMKINIEDHEIKLIPSIDESLWDS